MLQSYQDFQNAGRGNVFCAYGIVTAPVIWTTAAATGGPLLWNPSTSGVDAFLLGVMFGNSVASGVAGALGITGNTTQPSAPTSTTAIDSVANLIIGGPAPACSVYRVGTVANAGSFFMPIGMIHTGAITVDTEDDNDVDLGGAIIVKKNCWASVAASVTLTSAVLQIGLVWAEVATGR